MISFAEKTGCNAGVGVGEMGVAAGKGARGFVLLAVSPKISAMPDCVSFGPVGIEAAGRALAESVRVDIVAEVGGACTLLAGEGALKTFVGALCDFVAEDKAVPVDSRRRISSSGSKRCV